MSGYEHWHHVAILNDPCAYCGGKADTLDHIHPRSRGGTRGWHNVTAACGECNRRKDRDSLLGFLLGTRTRPRWFKRLAGLTAEPHSYAIEKQRGIR